MNKRKEEEYKRQLELLDDTVSWTEKEIERLLVEIEEVNFESKKGQLLDKQLQHMLIKIRRESKNIDSLYIKLLNNEDTE